MCGPCGLASGWSGLSPHAGRWRVDEIPSESVGLGVAQGVLVLSQGGCYACIWIPGIWKLEGVKVVMYGGWRN